MPRYELFTQGALHPHVEREWLLTDGAGGFAMGTAVGVNTRRYHGLYVPATQPPLGRAVLLGRVAETVLTSGGGATGHSSHELSGNFFGSTVHPNGASYLQRFMTDGIVAEWHYAVPGAKVVKALRLHEQGATLSYEVISAGAEAVGLTIQPFTAMRDFHHMNHAGDWLPFEVDGRAVTVSHNGYVLRMAASAGSFASRPDWWFGHTYPIDAERGQEDREDSFTPGVWEISGSSPVRWTLEVSSPGLRRPKMVPGDLTTTEPTGGKKTVLGPKAATLLPAAQAYLARRDRPDGQPGVTVLAGYPWFGDWGRDTFISLPGLMLTTGRADLARNVLSTFAQFVSEGMIPNRFSDNGLDIEYNTVDASLWFIHGAYAYLDAGGDKAVFTRELLPACQSIIEGYRRGTRFGIRMDPADGLIRQGDAETQLTWMDAKYQGIAFTPRAGKPVEINALWYHALCLMGEKSLAAQVKVGYQKFVRSDGHGLFDTIQDDGTPDAKIRPNQIFAVSLAHSPLAESSQRAVVDVVRAKLLTPHGLRSLAPDDAGYVGRYTGPQSQRDAAYHNGTVWGWLIGPFIDAYLRVEGESPAALKQAKQWLLPLFDHVANEGCFGHVAEIFDGDAPHRGVGCSAQAWSVAELLRVAAKVGM